MFPTDPAECVFPIAGPYSWGSPYGPRGTGFHNGWDLPSPTGTPVVAAFDGWATPSSSPAGGLEINLDLGDWRLYICHLSWHIGTARPVRRGDLIGRIGSTGHSTGPHAHVMLMHLGQHRNPLPFLQAILNNTGDTMTPEQFAALRDAVVAGVAAEVRNAANLGLLGNTLVVKEVDDLVRPIAEHLGITLPVPNVND